MGCIASKSNCDSCEIDLEDFREKITLLQEEIDEARCKRDKESRTYQQQGKVFLFREAEWKRERRKLREEVKRLRKKLEEKEMIIRGMKDEMVVGRSDKEWEMLGTSILVEHMMEEQARRDEAIEKWKSLYLAIKTELDDLIHRTYQGESLCSGAEANMMEELKRELKAKEEVVEVLKAQVAAMEEERIKKEREVDILRQSLRIMSNTKKLSSNAKKAIHMTSRLPQSLHL
ncbi:PREDICTED: trichohyalin-like [Nelumbo nucifera]|uniref:Uncharacterized protein n=2 Tax=Nelumbo nucifera TaxID=4432 RepID=A0A822XRM0_NELNU|nr:PREDICTED: trichohyalin-like [Nelumbo nucifera]DAD20118.1 TPA_asm: hypothetical protein HUJ06_021581 [Nelumbo nucifera]